MFYLYRGYLLSFTIIGVLWTGHTHALRIVLFLVHLLKCNEISFCVCVCVLGLFKFSSIECVR